jgi:thiamine-monophosphate kinase
MPTPGEFEIIERCFTRPCADQRVVVGIGDDAAIVAAEGPLAVAVDMLIAGTHFPQDLPAHAVGHRSLAVNLSDLAAVGATPRWATLALSLPTADTPWLDAFADGFFALADRSGVSLIGGDTTRGPLTITVQALGDAPARPLLRSGGQVGDCVFVSGTLGDSAAALEILQQTGGEPAAQADFAAQADALIERFSYPEPRIALGRSLAGIATAAIDVSDGLLADLGHLCEQSGCGAVLDLEQLPLSAAIRTLFAPDLVETFALAGGDDYELCFSCAADDVDRILAIAAETGTPVTAIGRLTEQRGIRGRRDGGAEFALAATGYVHF